MTVCIHVLTANCKPGSSFGAKRGRCKMLVLAIVPLLFLTWISLLMTRLWISRVYSKKQRCQILQLEGKLLIKAITTS